MNPANLQQFMMNQNMMMSGQMPIMNNPNIPAHQQGMIRPSFNPNMGYSNLQQAAMMGRPAGQPQHQRPVNIQSSMIVVPSMNSETIQAVS